MASRAPSKRHLNKYYLLILVSKGSSLLKPEIVNVYQRNSHIVSDYESEIKETSHNLSKRAFHLALLLQINDSFLEITLDEYKAYVGQRKELIFSSIQGIAGIYYKIHGSVGEP